MDRTVPRSGNDTIDLYIRTYYSLLRSTREVPIESLVEAHAHINSALHVKAEEPEFDPAAFTYCVVRLPECFVGRVRLVVMGQSSQVFSQHGYADVEGWQLVAAAGRRRRTYYDGQETLAVYIASRSDIDDLIPLLTAYQIEARKLHRLLRQPEIIPWLKEGLGQAMSGEMLSRLSSATGLATADLERLGRLWKEETAAHLLAIAQTPPSLSVRLLGGSLADYKRATRRWWENVEEKVAAVTFEQRPVYFVSSNTHSMANLLSGYALRQEGGLVKYIREAAPAELQMEYEAILQRHVPSRLENFLYYALKKYEGVTPGARDRRIAHERTVGIYRVPSQHVFDVEVQIIALNELKPEWLDPRLHLPGIETLASSPALIINVDFPLGMAAYQILSEIARNIAEVRGVYVMGKAATLNGRIGDVLIPNVIHDEHSLNTYLINNCFTADDIAPHLTYGSVLDNQKAISVLGTFLQNETYMAVFYDEGYTILEMEAGPYLSSVYEMVRPVRYPHNEIVTLYNAPFPIGVIHYASDTPFSRGQNLGTQNLSYVGMDPTYAASLAILRAVFEEEIRAAGRI